MKRVIVIFWSIFASTIISSASSLQPNSEFTPSIESPISNLWSWNELEIFNSMDIHCGAEDPSETLWFATHGKLLKYDGYETTSLHFPPEFENSGVIDLHISQSGDIYVYSTDGLLRYRNSEWSILVKMDLPLLWNRRVIQETPLGIVFAYTPDGLFKFKGDEISKVSKENNHRLCLAQSENALWLLRKDGITKLSMVDGDITQTTPRKAYPLDNYVRPSQEYRIAVSKSGEVIVTSSLTKQNPVLLNPVTETFEPLGVVQTFGPSAIRNPLYVGDSLLLFGNSLNLLRTSKGWERLSVDRVKPDNSTCVFKRKNDNIIVTGRNEAVYEIDTSGSRFQTLQQLNFQCESLNGNLWFISVEGAILEYNPQQSIWKQHHDPNIIESVVSLFQSSDGTIWASGSHNGTAAVSHYHNSNWTLDVHPQLKSRVSHLSPIELSNNDIIFGSGNESMTNGGIVIYRTNASSIYEKEYILPPTVPGRVESIAEGSDGIYSSGNRLYRWNDTLDYQEIKIPNNNVRWVDALCADNVGNIWTGSLDSTGVNKWDGQQWTQYTGKQYLESDQIVFITHDPFRNDLWINCRGGISRYSSKSDSWIPRALPKKIAFKRESGALKFDNRGNLWVNKSRRSWYFRTETQYQVTDELRRSFQTIRYTPDSHPPRVWIESHTTTVTENANILLTWKGADYFSITPQEELCFSYQINGGEWSTFAPSNNLLLEELNSGEYEIRVRCRDLDGNISNTDATTTFFVNPLLWKQPWFIALTLSVTLIILGLIVLVIRLRIQNILQLETFKTQFFMNISHELRTPLTVILGPLESLRKSDLSEAQRESLELAYKNSKKMGRLVDQLLEFRRLKLRKSDKHYTHSDVIEFIQDLVSTTRPLLDQHQQTLEIETSHISYKTWFESEKLEHIVQNLLINASKYTPDNGEIHIKLSITENPDGNASLEYIIEDNGIGIPKQRLKDVFNPFVRVHNPKSKPHNHAKGTGIGLAFVKEIIDFMQGSISVESPIRSDNKGTRFTVQIPLFSSVPEDQISNTHSQETTKAMIENGTDTNAQVLLVEDDEDIRNYLSSQLESFYNVNIGVNGKHGLEKAKEQIPDIIITDAMMPEMDGFAFSNQIKNSAETSHIPVLMLTALRADEHELKALEKGVDDFITKPVSIDILKQKISNQLHLRDLQHRKFEVQKAQGKFDGSNITSNQSDETFINKIVSLIESGYQDPKFDVESIAGQMFMSRTTLYRKFKAITGESPSQFIKTLRMNKAVELLKHTSLTISEISDTVGYNDPSYLGSTFKSQFGCTPSEYRKKHSTK